MRSYFDRVRCAAENCVTSQNVYSYDPQSKSLVVVGSKDIQAFINAPAEDCSIKSKITRYLNGDIYALGHGYATNIYTDVSGMPTDINTIHALCKKVRSQIDSVGAKDIPSFIEVLKSSINKKISSDIPLKNNNSNESEEINNA